MIIEVCLKREQEIGLAFSDRAHVICEIPKALYYILYFPMFFLLILFLLLKSQIFLILYLIKRFTRKQVLHVEKKTGVTSSNPRVTISNPPDTNSYLRVEIHNLRVQIQKLED